MRKNLYIIFGLLALAGFSSCQHNQQYFNLEGSIKGMSDQTVMLEELGFSETKLIDSTQSDKNGNFKLKGIYDEPALYRIRLGEQIMLVVIDGQQIKIKSDWNDLTSFTAVGSPGTSSLAVFMKQYINNSKDLLALEMTVDSLNTSAAPDSLLKVVHADLDGKTDRMNKFIEHYSDTTLSMPVALYTASKLLNDNREVAFVKTFAAGLTKRFPDSKLISEFKERVKEKVAEAEKPTGPAIGTIAPDFTLQTIDGKSIALKSLRGKFVLLDFWASWCPPCRAENPNVVAAYDKFKDKNFTILSVSLDNNKEKWQEAITKDKLEWQHASDLKGWESPVAALYAIESIPANFLIDPSGKIIAQDLKGDNLEKMLGSVLAMDTTKVVAAGK